MKSRMPVSSFRGSASASSRAAASSTSMSWSVLCVHLSHLQAQTEVERWRRWAVTKETADYQ